MNKKLTIFISIIIVILLIGITVLTIFKIYKPNKPLNAESPSAYSDNSLSVMKSLDLYETINNKAYSKTIEVLLENNALKKEYLNIYYEIDYVDLNNFSSIINQLIAKTYNSEEINYILTYIKDDINILLNMEYIDILAFKNITNFDINNLDRYLAYQEKNTDYDLATVVTYVNIGLDKEGYSEYTEYTTEEVNNDLTILVNKYHKLPDDYVPNDLVSLSYNENYYLRQQAAQAFESLTAAGILEGVIFYPFSPYRSFETQSVLYNRYVARDGIASADTYSARPGFSEHQLGLAVDVRSSNLSDNLTPEHYEWMLDNSYKYGFIVRYPKGKQHITQFIEEPWHLRYLGIELATKVHDSGLTYDEYYDIYMKTQD